MFGIVLLQAMARTRQALVISVAKTVLLLPLIFLLPLWWGRDGVLMAQPATVLLLTPPVLAAVAGVAGPEPCRRACFRPYATGADRP
jgi:O-antigen/teichoic acid export membrane protein